MNHLCTVTDISSKRLVMEQIRQTLIFQRSRKSPIRSRGNRMRPRHPNWAKRRGQPRRRMPRGRGSAMPISLMRWGRGWASPTAGFSREVEGVSATGLKCRRRERGKRKMRNCCGDNYFTWRKLREREKNLRGRRKFKRKKLRRIVRCWLPLEKKKKLTADGKIKLKKKIKEKIMILISWKNQREILLLLQPRGSFMIKGKITKNI